MSAAVIPAAVAQALHKLAAAGAITPEVPGASAPAQDTSWMKWDAPAVPPAAQAPTPAPVVAPPAVTPAPVAPVAKPFDFAGALSGAVNKAKAILPPAAQAPIAAAQTAGNVINKVKSMIPQGVKDLSDKSVANLKGLDTYYRGTTDLEGSPDYQAFQSANPGVAAPEAFKAVMGQRVGAALESNDPGSVGDVLGTLGRYASEGNPNAEQSKALLGTALQGINAKVAGLPPEQQAAYRQAFQNHTAAALLPPDAGLREGLKAMGVDPVKLYTDEVTREAVKATKAGQTFVAKAGEGSTTVGGLWDMFKDNPMNFLIPAGLLVATLFDGKVPKLLGAMAALYGGYNIYDRYKAISDPHDPAAGLISAGLQEEAAKAQADPNAKLLADPNASYAAMMTRAQQANPTGTPEQQKALADRGMQGLKDVQAAVKMGMGNRIVDRMLNTGRGIINLVGGDSSTLEPQQPTQATALTPQVAP